MMMMKIQGLFVAAMAAVAVMVDGQELGQDYINVAPPTVYENEMIGKCRQSRHTLC